MDEIEFGRLVLVNQNGINLEKTKWIDAAIEQYEWCVERHFEGNHPYERLRILYTKQGKLEDAIRVCTAFVEMADSLLVLGDTRTDLSPKRKYFLGWIKKLELRLG